MSTLTITEFLLARIAEDEAVARLSLTDGADLAIVTFNEDERDATNVLVIGKDRVLAECAAKRAIIAAHPIVDDVVEVSTRIKHGFACETCFSYGDIVEDNGYCDTLRALAAVYADHADYRQDWAL